MASGAEEARAEARATWSGGDYAEVGRTFEDCARVAVDGSGMSEGDSLLDVATGTGNAALEAARRGAIVTGLDVTPELLELARERAERESLLIQFDEGDASELPYEDGRFDRVVSVFGVMFAPDHAGAAAELMRVCRPGGRIAVAAWTPGGLNGQFFTTLGAHMPPPPEGFQPPVLWGTEDRVREIFAGAGEISFQVHRADGAVAAETTDAWLDFIERTVPPLIPAKQALEPEGKWAAARGDLAALYERFNEADDGTLRADPEYLLSVIVKSA